MIPAVAVAIALLLPTGAEGEAIAARAFEVPIPTGQPMTEIPVQTSLPTGDCMTVQVGDGHIVKSVTRSEGSQWRTDLVGPFLWLFWGSDEEIAHIIRYGTIEETFARITTLELEPGAQEVTVCR